MFGLLHGPDTEIDRGHAAFAELALDAVATSEGGVEAIYLGRHSA